MGVCGEGESDQPRCSQEQPVHRLKLNLNIELCEDAFPHETNCFDVFSCILSLHPAMSGARAGCCDHQVQRQRFHEGRVGRVKELGALQWLLNFKLYYAL